MDQDDGVLITNEGELTKMYGGEKIIKYTNFFSDVQLDEYYHHDTFKVRNIIYALSFEYNQVYKKYVRKYMKLQDIFGNVNGFKDFLIFIFSFINFYINYRFDYFLFDKFVNVKIDKKLFLNKEKEMKIINSKRESTLSKDKVNVVSKYNNDIKKETNDKNNKNHLQSNTIRSGKDSRLSGIYANNLDSTRKIFNSNKPKGIIPEENNEIYSSKGDSLRINRNMSAQNNRNFTLNPENRKKIIEKLEELSSSDSKYQIERFSIFSYCFKSKDKQKNFYLKLQKTYLNKINEKFEIFYYLKWIRQFKNLKKFIFKDSRERTIFKLLSSNAYNLQIKDFNDELFQDNKSLESIIEQWVKTLNSVNESDFTKYLFDNYQMKVMN